MLEDILALLADIPPRLSLMWVAWLVAGLALNTWHRRANRQAEYAQGYAHDYAPDYEPAPAPSRPKSDVKVAKPASAPRPASAGNAFGELEALLDTPDEPAPVGHHRRPGDSPSPTMNEAPTELGAPRALP